MSAYGFPKPPRGEFRRERRQRTKDRKAAEQAVMEEAKDLDGRICRRPFCPHCKNRPRTILAACHVNGGHRGMGGNPDLSRTTLEDLISLCGESHDDYANGLIEPRPHDLLRRFRSTCDWYQKNKETGRLEHYATESLIGISTAVGA